MNINVVKALMENKTLKPKLLLAGKIEDEEVSTMIGEWIKDCPLTSVSLALKNYTPFLKALPNQTTLDKEFICIQKCRKKKKTFYWR